MLVVRAGITKAEAEKILQICFETFNIPALLITTSAEIALYKSGLFNNDGVIVESGDDLTQVNFPPFVSRRKNLICYSGCGHSELSYRVSS